ncbi:peptidoglycan-binding domain-containing protein [Streptomyces albidoflavus]
MSRKMAAASAVILMAGGLSLATSGSANAAGSCTIGRSVNGGGGNTGYTLTVPAASNNSVDCTLSAGASNNAVRALQTALVRCGKQNITVDGVFGNGTKNALINVQRARGVTADGIYGNNTRNAMLWPWKTSNHSKCDTYYS